MRVGFRVGGVPGLRVRGLLAAPRGRPGRDRGARSPPPRSAPAFSTCPPRPPRVLNLQDSDSERGARVGHPPPPGHPQPPRGSARRRPPRPAAGWGRRPAGPVLGGARRRPPSLPAPGTSPPLPGPSAPAGDPAARQRPAFSLPRALAAWRGRRGSARARSAPQPRRPRGYLSPRTHDRLQPRACALVASTPGFRAASLNPR